MNVFPDLKEPFLKKPHSYGMKGLTKDADLHRNGGLPEVCRFFITDSRDQLGVTRGDSS